ncbi:alpha/beta-hydrolase [Dothidotthia symphoricarpi CBS 119687]|uniref:Carboxylic ester hydrolase n=1 Tax=Dothidotthia symphoricarpi CBS 119687 TaxID=1392245 RepID=A0A6A6AM29_9PLEO|nr:alpha/beta-hydrolase [Dothidotthia symphoricarpi CBS 119687]KAF2132223.1 alpha/beta-hydrolase [Dothidotthia symphoricarpi CBS 119687]
MGRVTARAWSLCALSTCLFATLTWATQATVAVLNGTYEGLHLPSFNQDIFLGIPYAQDTGGQNRFRIPQSLNTTWNGTRSAKQYGHSCPDPQPERDGEFGMSEDCLSINVVRPIGNYSELPVVTWIHGGSYQVGTSALPNYNLTYIVQRSVEIGKPIIATSINYRKGGWGMMYSREIQGSGNTNLALRDMRKGLSWIQENIGAFGGNKDSVTIWGESAGSFAVGQLLLSYGGRTDSLFHRSIQESGSAATAWYNGTDWYQPIYDAIVTSTNCTDEPDTLACLRTVPYDTLLPFLAQPIQGPGWYPTVDGDIIPAYPTQLLHSGAFAHVPHLYGSNSDEGTDNAPAGGVINTDKQLWDYIKGSTGFGFPDAVVDRILALYPNNPAQGIPLNTGVEIFAEQGLQYKRIAAIMGDAFYHATRLDDARQYAKYAPTYVYRFNTRPWESGGNSSEGGLAPAYKGVQHFSEVAFVFANPEFVGPWKEYKSLSDEMSAQWIHFINGGDPNGDELPGWPVYNASANGFDLVIQADGRGYNGSYVEEDTWRLEGREYLIEWARRRHV